METITKMYFYTPIVARQSGNAVYRNSKTSHDDDQS